MDDFTQNILERAKLRRQKLQGLQIATPIRASQPLQENQSINTNNQRPSALIEPEKPTSFLKSSSRASQNTTHYTPKNAISSATKSRLRQLGALYSDDKEVVFEKQVNWEPAVVSKREFVNVESVKGSNVISSVAKTKLKRLGELYSQNGDSLPDTNLATYEKTKDTNYELDETTVKALESQGFAREPEKKLVYNFQESPKVKNLQKATKLQSPKEIILEQKKSPFKISDSPRRSASKFIGSPTKPSETRSNNNGNFRSSPGQNSISTSAIKRQAVSPLKTSKLESPRYAMSPGKKSPKMGVSALDKESSVLKRAAMFEKSVPNPTKTKDPAELTLAERKALFEINKGEALLPKVAFSTPLPAKLRSPIKKEVIPNFKKKQENKMCELKDLFERDLVETTNVNMSKLEREKDLDFLRNRWNRNKEISGYTEETTGPAPPPPPMPAPVQTYSPQSPPCSPSTQKTPPYVDSPKTLKVLNEVKEIVVSPPKEGHLYPSLTDLEPESDNSSSLSLNDSRRSNLYLNMSFGDILEASKNLPMTPPCQTNESRVLNEMDELLDAALGDVSSSDDDEPSPPKQKKADSKGSLSSSSFEYAPTTPVPTASTPLSTSVSFYRRQQTKLRSSKNTAKDDVTEKSSGKNVDEAVVVQRKIEELQMEVYKQQTVISQASNLLSMCMANIEFSGSGEQVEGERLLLLAGHKRQACFYELNRLKVDGTLRPLVSNCEQLKDQGDLILSNISIPLKREALRAMSADESMQYFVCLIKCDDRVVATPVVAATSKNLQENTLIIPGKVRLEKLFSDFKVTVEVYNLQLSQELIPHHLKYHLPTNKKDRKLLTPIKSKKSQPRLITPNIQSPAGPNAIRTTNFQMCGYFIFSLRELKRSDWTLQKVPYTSPLKGTISMQIESDLQLDSEFRGFLTMFEDVAGFGAWRRQWCVLSAYYLSYWKYPDDEHVKVPLGTIDLRSVVTGTVGLVPGARLNTFKLETTRPRTSEDVASLVLVLEGDLARIKILLSSDTRFEALEWCSKLNKALALIRAWGVQS